MPEITFPAKESADQVELRKGQGDPLVMYLVVRKSLDMSPEKMAAQCAHAAQMIAEHYHGLTDSGGLAESYHDWRETSFRKVVVYADDKQWERVKQEPDLHFAVVRDAGLTEVEAGSETVIGVWPRVRSSMPGWWRRLQARRGVTSP